MNFSGLRLILLKEALGEEPHFHQERKEIWAWLSYVPSTMLKGGTKSDFPAPDSQRGEITVPELREYNMPITPECPEYGPPRQEVELFGYDHCCESPSHWRPHA